MLNVNKQFYPEIQGLRAVSIVAVILFHFGVHLVPGGYIGVDMFFVISGFLITKMITGELAHGTFSLARFYRNRVVRLLPNLFLMIAASAVISYLVLRPYDFFQYAKSLQFSAVYLTNMVFARQQGYFDMSRDVKPLLHTWSLSIEEQFYLIFPLLLILLYKLKNQRLAILLAIAAASLWVRLDYVQQHLPTQGFFSFAGRVWEFVVGALVALMPVALRNRLARNEALSAVALLLVLGSLAYLDESLPHSALLLVVPCLATAMLIASSGGTHTGKLLGGKTMVYIGALSYSLYLWHWPLLVWVHNADLELGRYAEIALLLASTWIVSWLAWKFVEEPVRDRRERIGTKMAGAFVLVFGVFCVGVGGYIYANKGLEERFPNWVAVQKNLAAYDFKAETGMAFAYPAGCEVNGEADAILRSCAFGDKQSDNRFLLIGDSHTLASYPAYQVAAERRHAQGVLATLSGCPPIYGVASYDGAKNICLDDLDRRLDELIEKGRFRKVFMAAFWSMYTDSNPDDQPNHFVSDAQTIARDGEASKRVIAQHLAETIRRMNARGIEVIIMHNVPPLPKNVQDLPPGYARPIAEVRKQAAFMQDFVRQWPGLTAFDATAPFCDESACRTVDEHGNVLYGDNNHVSPAGAVKLIGLIEPLL